jgi:CHASE2 domain-containing sensor protein/two-component sensor histidine kinase
LRDGLWQQIKQQATLWRIGAMPGLVVVGCVAIARLSGALQILEWMAFDYLLRARPIEAPDARIVIVGINEADIRAVGKYPIPDQALAQLLNVLQQYQPRVIGLDLFRDLTADAGRTELSQAIQRLPNLIGIEAALSSDITLQVRPPPELPPERVGLADTILDPDGKLRRTLSASKVESGDVKYSLAIRLASAYLRSHNVSLVQGSRASNPIYLDAVELPRFQSNTGGYINAQSGGNQLLLNFRSHPDPFPVVSLTEVLSRQVSPALLSDRIVLIGMTAASSSNDTFFTAATKGTLIDNALGEQNANQYQLLYGVEHHAHATSQLIGAVLDQRPLLRSWSEGGEYLWIVAWGIGGAALGLWLQSPWKTLLGIAVASTLLIGISYGFLLQYYWIPVIPTIFALLGAGLTTAFFDQRSRLLLAQRDLVLKRTYDLVHNGPLQTLAAILRSSGDESISPDRIHLQLQALNQELRSVFESMQQAIQPDNQVLNASIADLLHQVYETTLRRELPGFTTICTFIRPDFSVLEDCPLTADQKQELCLFLEEALCNVGKHAIEARRLDVNCTRHNQEYHLQIINDGIGNGSDEKRIRAGRGTAQAVELARSLRGEFQRRFNASGGTLCELTWPAPKQRLKP